MGIFNKPIDEEMASEFRLPKHRFLELKRFCAQYENMVLIRQECLTRLAKGFDPTGQLAVEIKYCSDRIRPIDEVLDDMFVRPILGIRARQYYDLRNAIFTGSKPVPEDVYNYRKFFWLLDKKL